MKELKEESVYIEDFDITVNLYLTYTQIQETIKAVKQYQDWKTREETIDMLVLLYATDIGREKLEALGHDILLQSGLIDIVFTHVKNWYRIHEGVNYEESVAKALFDISNKLPDMMNPLKEVVNRAASKK